MPATKKEKEQIIASLLEKLQKSKSAVFADFTGLKVFDAEKLRKSAKKEKAELLVSKKTLLKIALKKAGLAEVPVDDFKASVATLFSYADDVAGPKLVAGFARDKKPIALLSGLLMSNEKGRRYLSLAQINFLASLPSRQELLGKLVSSIKSPLSGLVNVLAGNLRGLVNALNSIKESKSK